jgi:thymidylate synthase (FAD)
MKVQIIDHTESPIITIYKAYRICYSKDVPTEIKIPMKPNPLTSVGDDVPDYDKMLDFIKAHSNHQSCLEHVSFTFAIEGVSRALSHQLVRHRLASYSQQSQRYVNGENFDFIIPPTIKNNVYNTISTYKNLLHEIRECYKDLIEMGIPKEDARYILPNATTTNLIMTMNCRELINFFGERLCIHAQCEIREMANLMNKEVNEILPIFNKKDIMRCGKTCFECSKDKNEKY